MSGKLIICQGLPGSGKSTFAKQMLGVNPDIIIVCKDDIRETLTKQGWKWSQENEKDVIRIRDQYIQEALSMGKTVISADCNFGKHPERLKQIAKGFKAEVEITDFTKIPVETCIERDSKRENPVGSEVIRKMQAQYLASVAVPEVYMTNHEKPPTIICDLDGTLAIHNGRSPYDYARCNEDSLNTVVASIILAFYELGVRILYVSGREDFCAPQTIEFLEKYKMDKHSLLLMRKSGDKRPDNIIKREIFDSFIRNQYNVKFVLDDRDKVVKMWRELGLTCLQVAEGNF